MEDTWHFLQRLPECNGKVGAVGYCLGGKLCYLMCCRTDIDCAVAYYGTYIEHRIREAKNLHRPFVLHMALKDRWVQAEVNELLERRLSPKQPKERPAAATAGQGACKWPKNDVDQLSLRPYRVTEGHQVSSHDLPNIGRRDQDEIDRWSDLRAPLAARQSGPHRMG